MEQYKVEQEDLFNLADFDSPTLSSIEEELFRKSEEEHWSDYDLYRNIFK